MQNILKAISKIIGNEITEDMDLLKVIGNGMQNYLFLLHMHYLFD